MLETEYNPVQHLGKYQSNQIYNRSKIHNYTINIIDVPDNTP